jgi:hypothetical protein
LKFLPIVCEALILCPLVAFAIFTHDSKSVFRVATGYLPVAVSLAFAILLPALVLIYQRQFVQTPRTQTIGNILCSLALITGLVTDAVLILGISICC